MRTVITFLAGLIVGIVVGVGAGFFAYPFVFRPPVATETVSEADVGRPLARGTFIHANPRDPLHWGQGEVTVYERTVFLEKSFKVGPGPAYYVYLVPKANIRTNDDLKGVMFVDLGQIKSFEGSQRYNIPAGVDVRNYQSVVIWCKEFSVLISPADIKFL